MPFAAALSTAGDTERALDEVCRRGLETMNGKHDQALVFFSPHNAGCADSIATTLKDRLEAKCLLGCSGEAIVGNSREIESRPAISLWLARWAPDVRIEPFHLELEETPDG